MNPKEQKADDRRCIPSDPSWRAILVNASPIYALAVLFG